MNRCHRVTGELGKPKDAVECVQNFREEQRKLKKGTISIYVRQK
jgi:hypothetical protein